MLRKYGIVRPSVLAIIAVFSLMACSTMDLKDYPEATEEIFADAHMINGVSVVVQPLLDEEESLRYFGVDLTDKNILAIHVAIRNADKNNSYLVFSDALQISPKDAIDITHGPERGSQVPLCYRF